LQCRTNEVWTTEILPANQTAQTFPDFAPDVIAISTVDRTGNLSLPIALKKTMPAPIRPRKLLMYE